MRSRRVTILINLFLFLASIYLLWGWITINDIIGRCKTEGLDVDKVLTALITGPPDIVENRDASEKLLDVNIKPQEAPVQFHRYTLAYEFETKSEENMGNPNQTIRLSRATVGPLEPFLHCSDNFRNVLFCLGLGYLMSSVLLILRYLKKVPLANRYLLFRPIAGALAAVCLFVTILSGGKMFWASGAELNSSSVGLIGALGAFYCERFESFLFPFGKKEEGVNPRSRGSG